MQKFTPFLMFEGKAEEALSFYVSLFPESEVIHVTHYGADGPGVPGSIQHATFLLGGQPFMCIDSAVEHGFTFTPAISFHVTCESEEEIDRLFERLSDGGHVHMPLDAYPFTRKYGWVDDRFGVSWQLTLP